MAKIGEYNDYIDFLGSDLNNYMSGSCVVIDGGATNIFNDKKNLIIIIPARSKLRNKNKNFKVKW